LGPFAAVHIGSFAARAPIPAGADRRAGAGRGQHGGGGSVCKAEGLAGAPQLQVWG